MSTRVYLFRHGRSAANDAAGYVWGRCEASPLVPRGIQEAVSLRDCLHRSGLTPVAVFTSPAVRARQTAELATGWMIREVLIIVDPRLHEQDVGEWAGEPVADVFTEECLRNIKSDGKDFRPPGGESMNDVAQRMLAWLEDIPRLGEVTVFAFTHGGAIRALASTVQGLSHAQAYPIQPATASVSLLCADEGGPWQFSYIGHKPAHVFAGPQ